MNHPKIVYFDQKGWIDLAKIQYGCSSNPEKALLEKILHSADNETAIFPISMANLAETLSIHNPRKREQLASLMIRVSKYNSITPYFADIIDVEIKNLFLEKLGLPTVNIRERFIGKGFAMLMGGTLSANSKGFDPKIIEELNQHLTNQLNDLQVLKRLITISHYSYKHTKLNKEYVRRFERIRNKFSLIKDNDQRRRVSLKLNTLAVIAPRLNEILKDIGVPFILDIETIEKLDIDRFLEKLPTSLCMFTLLFQRDQQIQRPIQVNDIDDIFHLTLAIPLSDMVVTEKMWASIAKGAKLDQKCGTAILSSLKELNDYL